MSLSVRTRVRGLFGKMDLAFDKAARGYGFVCNGCDENCCQSLFFHHTLVEKAYLHHGLSMMGEDEQKDILEKARAYTEHGAFAPGADPNLEKPMCPLFAHGRCRMYPFRPMICRLHGLPHELARPMQPVVRCPGCRAGHFEDKPYQPFDRTPFYQEMAMIEMAFRQEIGQTGKYKQTIAQMLLDAPSIQNI